MMSKLVLHRNLDLQGNNEFHLPLSSLNCTCEYENWKVFYTSLGHSEATWGNPDYQKHIIGGIEWALGLEKGDAKPQAKQTHLA